MSSRLAKVLATIQSALGRVPDLTFKTGWRKLAEQASPPRIVWQPNQDSFVPAMASVANPRPVMTRFAGVLAHCWGRDEEMAEELAHQLITALHETLGSNQTLQLGGGRWATQDVTSAGWIKLGEVYELQFAIGIPVVRAPWALQAVSDVRFTGPDAVSGDGILTTGES